ncbi:MAG: uroporphyrinogen-III decarboxylase-like protein, partial [Candidatus Latescibacteria bacterium]|nr:uroporphyrinogen-III decarboxylase-like protein [Candidatus Latescibacterota bacterium]
MTTRTLRITPDPDFGRLEKVLRRQGVPDRVPFYELFSNIEYEILRAIGKDRNREPIERGDRSREAEWLEQHITYMYSLGYDYVNVGALGFDFPMDGRPKAMTDQGEVAYLQGMTHTIAAREDFETYPWPDGRQADFSLLEQAETSLPDGMKVIAGFSGILENVMWLLGYEGISYLLTDDETMVRDMFEAVGTRIIAHFDSLASFDVVGALQLGEDMGFKTQTMLSPEVYREYLFPWHRKLVETVHRHGKPIILHSCGNLEEIMDDIIDCGWDAKHSFEDVIEPVWEFKAKYGDRIAILGGFDMDSLSRMSEEDVRDHTRFLIETCAPGGGWALGTGNS